MQTDAQIAGCPIHCLPEERRARMGDRVFAVVLDTIVLFPLLWLVISCVAIAYGLYENGNATMNGGPALLAISGITGLWILYYIVCEGWFAGTPGKHVMGIEVLSNTRAPISLSQAVIRNIVRPVDAIGLYLLGFLEQFSKWCRLFLARFCDEYRYG
jgi:uncharacterized RDD family membrane protein YckC